MLLFQLGIVLLVAFVARAIYFEQARSAPSVNRLVIDSEAYDRAARGWLDGSWPGEEVYYQDPLYPYFLGLHYKLIGDSPSSIRFTQHLLGVIGLVCFFFLVRNVRDGKVATLASLLAATLSTRLFYEGLVLKTALGLVLLEASLFLIVLAPNRRPRLSFLAGLLLGACVLVRANILALAPLALMWILGLWPGQRKHEKKPIDRRLLRASFAILGFAIAVAPFTWHNIRCGTFALTTSQAGPNFYIGNNAGNDSGSYRPPPGVRAHPFFERIDFTRLAEEDLGRELKPGEVSSYWFEKAFAFIKEQPGDALKLTLLKLELFLNHFEVPDNFNLDRTRREIPLLKAPLPVFWFLWILGVIGFVAVRKTPALWFLATLLTVLTFSVVAFFIFSRYRLSAVPILTVFAALAPFEVYRLVKEKCFTRLSVVIIAGALAALVTSRDAYQPRQERVLYNDAMNAVKDGKKREAWVLLQDALTINPGYTDAMIRFGMLELELGDPLKAETILRSALDRVPNDQLVWRELGKALMAQGSPEKYESSLEAFSRALEIDPTQAPSIVGTAQIHKKMGNEEQGMQVLREWLQENPNTPGVAIHLGVFCAERGDFAQAEKAFRKELETDPTNEQAHAFLLKSLRAQGKEDEASSEDEGARD